MVWGGGSTSSPGFSVLVMSVRDYSLTYGHNFGYGALYYRVSLRQGGPVSGRLGEAYSLTSLACGRAGEGGAGGIGHPLYTTKLPLTGKVRKKTISSGPASETGFGAPGPGPGSPRHVRELPDWVQGCQPLDRWPGSQAAQVGV